MEHLRAVNDMVVRFANVNGTGSASANNMFAKSIFRMGIPVAPKNIFPSNIQGLPTWYEVRVSEKGYLGRREGVDLMIVTDPSNMNWLTGYDGWSFYVHQCVIIPPGGEPIWFGRGQDANGAKLTAYLRHENILGYPDHYVQSTERHPMDYLSAQLTDRGWGGLRLGVEMDNYYFSAAAFAALTKHLPNARFSDCTGLVNWQRAVKSPQEIAYMRNACLLYTSDAADE